MCLKEIGIANTYLHEIPAPYETAFTEFILFLVDQGYSQASVASKATVIAKFGCWLSSKQLSLSNFNENAITVFFKEFPRAGYVRRGDLSCLHQLLNYLRETGITGYPEPKIVLSEIDRIENDFSQHLKKERGLSQVTIDHYLPAVRNFLCERFGCCNIVLDEIKPCDVSKFILNHVKKQAKKSCQTMTTALRVFFRFLKYRGDITSNLDGCVPPVANWQLSELPKSLASEKIEYMLQQCDQSTAIGQRDYAILLLLTRLGLRTGEIVSMTLDDFNWDNGVLTIKGKGNCYDKLPIPQDVGEAISTYLITNRPVCSTRKLFIRSRAPYRAFFGSAAICDIVRRALKRAGLNPLNKGAYLLRHSLACSMLEQGISLSQIGEILRHNRLETTEIYAKVNFAALSSLAQPWPGGTL